MNISIKVVFGFISFILAIICFIPYWRDIFAQKTKPHLYSWLIWAILQIIGVIGIILGGGGYYAILGIGFGAMFCLSIFFLSFKFGTKNITKSDTFSLVGALVAILILLIIKNPIYSILLISFIDFVGFIPTLRKGYEEPFTETISTYLLAGISDVFALLALTTFSISTSFYLTILVFSNLLFVLILVFRRKKMELNRF